MLVLDFGGGTLDVSILEVQKDEFKMMAMRGRKWLGGRDLDEQIRKEMVKRIKAQFDYDFTNQRDIQMLLERCERLKIDLSTQRESRFIFNTFK